MSLKINLKITMAGFNSIIEILSTHLIPTAIDRMGVSTI